MYSSSCSKDVYESMMSRKTAKVDFMTLVDKDVMTKPDKVGSAAAVPMAAGIVVSLIGLMVAL